MSAKIRPLDDALVMLGRARTGVYREVYHVAPGENPYELEIAADRRSQARRGRRAGLRQLQPHRTVGRTAVHRLAARKAAGCVTDGLTRDIRAIRAMKFPVFHGGIGPLDSKGRGQVAAIDVPVECAGVQVEPGDLVLGDADGVIVIPKAVEDEVLAAAFEKVSGEDRTRDALRKGEKLEDVFARYGILYRALQPRLSIALRADASMPRQSRRLTNSAAPSSCRRPP